MNWQLGLNFYSTTCMLFDPKNLESEETLNAIRENKFHIYIICKRKRLYLESSVSEEPGVGKTTMYFLDEKHDKKYSYYNHPFVINSAENGLLSISMGGKTFFYREYGLINDLCFLADDLIGDKTKEPLLSDLEVMYVGQAFGRKKRKTIDYRLVNHDKIQKVALEILRKGTNEEVLIIGLKIEVSDLATSIVNVGSGFKKLTLDDIKKLQKHAAQRIPESQEITVFEASLIKYLQPKLNIEYKQTFPTPDFDSYNELFKINFNYSAMAIDTRPLGVRIFSEHVPERKYLHQQYFPLSKTSDKKSLFEYLIELND